jgi:hypothetical protein
MLDVSGCSVEKQAIGEGEQRAIPAFSHSISEAKTIAFPIARGHCRLRDEVSR